MSGLGYPGLYPAKKNFDKFVVGGEYHGFFKPCQFKMSSLLFLFLRSLASGVISCSLVYRILSYLVL